jgi:hypothetical protein
MQASKRQPAPADTSKALAELAADIADMRPALSAQLTARLAAGEDIAGALRAHRNNRKRWALFRRVAKWATDATPDKELDQWAKLE